MMGARSAALAVLLFSAMAFAGPAAPVQDTNDVTDKSLKSIDRATSWLLKAQNRDGSWGIDSKGEPDVTCTSLAAMAMMAAGNTERSGPHQASIQAVRQAVEWMLKRAEHAKGNIARSDSTLIQGKLGHTVHTFFAVVFLSQAYGMRIGTREQLQEMREIISEQVAVISKTQEGDGSWHKNTFGSLKATCMAWLALRAADSVGIDVNDATVDKVLSFIRRQFDKGSGLCVGQYGVGSYQTIYATASCLRVLYGMGQGGLPECPRAADALMKFVKDGAMGQQYLTCEGEDFLSAAMMTQAMLIEDGERWKKWFPWIRDELIKRQANDGSWTGTACISGRTFATSCALLTLQAPFRLLPISEQ
jgi:hypothetical protein